MYAGGFAINVIRYCLLGVFFVVLKPLRVHIDAVHTVAVIGVEVLVFPKLGVLGQTPISIILLLQYQSVFLDAGEAAAAVVLETFGGMAVAAAAQQYAFALVVG